MLIPHHETGRFLDDTRSNSNTRYEFLATNQECSSPLVGIQARDIGKALYIGGDRQVGSELDIDNFLNGLLLLAQARGMTEEVKALKAEHTKPFEKFTPRKLLFYADKEK